MKVIGYDPFLNDDIKDRLPNHVTTVNTLDELYPQCDFITLHIPCNDKTKNTLNEEAFEKMGEKRPLEACRKAIKSCEEVFPSAIYALEVWSDLMTRMNLIKNNLLDL